jgi:hypothetical protein
MSSKIAKWIFASIGCSMLLFGLALPGSAQTPTPIPPVFTPTPPPVAPTPPSAPTNPDLVSFQMIGQQEILLIGPLDSTSFLITLPADWKLTSGGLLDLLIGVSFNTLTSGVVTPNAAIANAAGAGGTLSVSVDNVLVGVVTLNQVGETENIIQIPPNALRSNRPDGRLQISFTLDARFSCYAYHQASVSIHPTSSLTLPHGANALSTNLANFPQPIFQGSFVPDSAILVIPDQPTTTDLQEALTVAAGLGSLSGNALLMDLVPLGQLTPAQEANNHLVFLGKAGSLQALSSLPLPVPLTGAQFKIPGGAADDGLVQMIVSPWSANHVVLVASGNSDAGALKAAQAISSGRLFTVQASNISVIQQVQPAPVVAPNRVDLTLADLGYPARTFTQIGVDTSPYQFYIPPGTSLAADADFNLIFGNSALLNYDRSGIIIQVNNIPIGSVRLSSDTASRAQNSLHFSIPDSAVHTGYNTLSIKANLIPLDDCTPANLQGAWVQVWANSLLHLPLNQTAVSAASSLDLAQFPAPFTSDPTLAGTAFVLAHNDLPSWRGAAQMAGILGERASGPLTALSVYYADSVPAADRSKYNFVVIGVPSQLPIMSDLNAALPVPFAKGASAPGQGNFQVTYRIPEGSPAGFVELMASPWNASNVVLAVLGNASQGVSWATAGFTDPLLRQQLAGNFAVINGSQVLTSDTRVSGVSSGSQPGQTPVVAVLPPNGTSPASPAGTPGWLLPVLILAILAAVLLVGAVVMSNRARNRGKLPPRDH